MRNFLFTILLTFCATINIQAITVDVDGIRYWIISTEDLTVGVQGLVDTEMENVVIPEYIEYYGKQFKVTEIREGAFRTKNIKKLVIPDNVIKIGPFMASQCEKLEKVVFGRGTQDISRLSIYLSPKLDYAFIPNNVKTIEFAGIVGSDFNTLIIEDSQVKIKGSRYNDLDAKIYWSDKSTFCKVKPYSYSLFACCNIKNLYLGRNMVTEAAYDFGGFPRVENLTVGPYVTSIQRLFNLDYMQKIKLMTSTPPAFERGNATEECYMRVRVFVPKGSLNAYKAHSEWSKYWNIEEYDDSCEAPEISYTNGMLKVTPVSSGSICYYTINDDDIVTDKEMTGGVQLTGTYNIEAYAMLNGSKSSRSYATLCWFDNSFTTDGITQTLNESKRPILVKSVNGQITVEGTEDSEVIDLYTIDGKHVERTSSIGSHATFNTMQQAGQILILRAGENSIKFVVR